MGKRSRRSHNPKHSAGLPPPSPVSGPLPSGDRDRLLLDAIADGELDHFLRSLADAIDARRHLLHTVKAATALAALCVGDQVRINDSVSPKYLHGACGRVIDVDEDSATVCLHRPLGRFKSGHVRCPPLALDRVQPQAAAS